VRQWRALHGDLSVTVDMGAPTFAPEHIPFAATAPAATYALDLGGRAVTISALSMGNPHAVQIVDNVDTAPVGSDGPKIEGHPRFPQRVNAGYLQIVDRSQIRLRVYERGVGETLSCGTGACAAAVVGIRRGLMDSPVRVATRGGELIIAWGGAGQAVFMTGEAKTVFHGEIEVAIR
jgi:diaminopimelate epimerase